MYYILLGIMSHWSPSLLSSTTCCVLKTNNCLWLKAQGFSPDSFPFGSHLGRKTVSYTLYVAAETPTD